MLRTDSSGGVAGGTAEFIRQQQICIYNVWSVLLRRLWQQLAQTKRINNPCFNIQGSGQEEMATDTTGSPPLSALAFFLPFGHSGVFYRSAGVVSTLSSPAPR